jgi:hypothetical protein
MADTSPVTRARRALAVTAALALGLAAVACGSESDPLDVQAPPTDVTAPEPDAPAPVEEQAIEVGAELYFAGFHVEVEEARYLPGDGYEDPMVELDATTENLRDDDAFFPANVLELRWGDQAVTTWSSGDIVRPGATSRTTFEFPVDETFAFDDAVLYAGTERQIQAVVPLSDPGGAVAAAPIPVEAPADAARDETGVLEVVITDATLLPYDPWGYQPEQAAVDAPFLAFVMDITLLEGRYDANIMDSSFRLVLPDGTQVGPQRGPNEVLSVGAVERDVKVSFELRDVPFDEDALTDDAYTLLIAPSGVDVEAEVEITMVLVPAG